MRITGRQLRQIIKEELERSMLEADEPESLKEILGGFAEDFKAALMAPKFNVIKGASAREGGDLRGDRTKGFDKFANRDDYEVVLAFNNSFAAAPPYLVIGAKNKVGEFIPGVVSSNGPVGLKLGQDAAAALTDAVNSMAPAGFRVQSVYKSDEAPPKETLYFVDGDRIMPLSDLSTLPDRSLSSSHWIVKLGK